VEAEALVEDPRSLDDFLAHYVSHCFKLQTAEYIPRHAVLCVMVDYGEVRFVATHVGELESFARGPGVVPENAHYVSTPGLCFLQAFNLGRSREIFHSALRTSGAVARGVGRGGPGGPKTVAVVSPRIEALVQGGRGQRWPHV